MRQSLTITAALCLLAAGAVGHLLVKPLVFEALRHTAAALLPGPGQQAAVNVRAIAAPEATRAVERVDLARALADARRERARFEVAVELDLRSLRARGLAEQEQAHEERLRAFRAQLQSAREAVSEANSLFAGSATVMTASSDCPVTRVPTLTVDTF